MGLLGRLGFTRSFDKEPLELEASGGTGIQKASLWWEQTLYTQQKRKVIYKFRGIPLFSRYYKLSTWDAYSNSVYDLTALFDNLAAAELIPALGRTSRVLEPGSGVGRNLKAIYDRYHCEVTGIDISKDATDLARNRMFAGLKNCSFRVADLLKPETLVNFQNDEFDLVFTYWHLIHIPSSVEKTAYVQELKRIGKALVMMEPAIVGRAGVEQYNNGTYVLSWDDWILDYGMNEFTPTPPIPDNTRVYVWSSSKTRAST